MKKAFLIFMMLCLAGCTTAKQASEDVEPVAQEVIQEKKDQPVVFSEDPQLRQIIENLLEEHSIEFENVAVVVENLETGQSYALNENEIFTAASVYKLPLAMLYYEAIAAGDLSADTLYTFLPEYYEDAGVLSSEYELYSEVPLSVLLQYTILYSDNNAGHVLFENLGGWINYVQLRQKYYQDNWKQAEETEQADEDFGDPVYLDARYYRDEIQENNAEAKEETELDQAEWLNDQQWDFEEEWPDAEEEPVYYEDWDDEELVYYEDWDDYEGELIYEEWSDPYDSLDNIIDARLVADTLLYIYEHQDIFSSMIVDMKESQPTSYLNGYLNDFYAQKYGAYGSVLNIAGLSLNEVPYLVVVLSQYESEAEDFINDLGAALYEYFTGNTIERKPAQTEAAEDLQSGALLEAETSDLEDETTGE